MNKVYPNLGLDFDVIKRAKKMAIGRVDNHAWADMNEEGILRSSGLILIDPDTGKEGITLAAILLFGKDSTIMSVLPQYKTDAIYRVKNMDRYDDRDVVITNLIDSFRRLMDFGKKHLNKFEAFPKNPPISKVFREIGYADELGSGMRNTNKYTKLYSGGTPIFIEDNIFRINIPIDNVANLKVGPGATAAEIIMNNDFKSKNETCLKQVLKQSDYEKLKLVIAKLSQVEEISIQEVMKLTNKSRTTAWRYMQILVDCGAVESTGNTNNASYKRC